jgi:hypothetical protein
METRINDTDVDELGPVDCIVVEFPADRADFAGEIAAELSALVDRGLVRVLDLILHDRRGPDEHRAQRRRE